MSDDPRDEIGRARLDRLHERHAAKYGDDWLKPQPQPAVESFVRRVVDRWQAARRAEPKRRRGRAA